MNIEATTALAIRGRQRIARGLVAGEFEPARYEVGGPDGLDLEKVTLGHPWCSLCAGEMAPVGIVIGFYVNDTFAVAHIGCCDEARNWTGE